MFGVKKLYAGSRPAALSPASSLTFTIRPQRARLLRMLSKVMNGLCLRAYRPVPAFPPSLPAKHPPG